MPHEVKRDYPFSQYFVKDIALTEKDSELVNDILSLFDRKMTPSAFCKKYDFAQDEWRSFLESLDVLSLYQPLPPKEKEALQKELEVLLKKVPAVQAVARRVIQTLYGYALIQPILDDEEIEDVMINGSEEDVWVYHRRFGMCKTNLRFSQKQLETLLSQFSSKEAWDDVRLVDGSRANVIKPPASPYPAITIRLFRQNPFSLIDLIQKKTFSIEAAAFLWTAFEGLSVYPLNVLVVGGTAAGKTATLNAVASFIPPHERIVTIEDTAELNLVDRENWIQLVSNKNATAQDLLTNALRMRPDRILVGEVRGAEAETLFTAMNIGHRGVGGTLHANNDRDAMLRLENKPMDVPPALLPLADLVVVQHRVYDRRQGIIRRIVQISEVSRTEAVTGLNEIFAWDAESDSLRRTDSPSASVEKLARATLKTPAWVINEIKERQHVLEYLLEKNIYKHKDVCAFLAEYYKQSKSA